MEGTLENNFSEITEDIIKLKDISLKNNEIDQALYAKHKVKKGLRDKDGKGVVTGITDISEVQGKEIQDGIEVPAEGVLYYRGYSINDLVNGFMKEKRFGFEETTYLLMFGELPNEDELKNFIKILSGYRTLPTSFVRDIIMKAPSFDMMNTLSRSVLTLYSYDENPNDTSISNVIRQSLQLVSLFPLLSVYGYHAYDYYYKQNSLIIHTPKAELSTAENILYMLRPNSQYTELEAKILDISLVLHAEHGGGNNSTFTTHVVSSSGTDTYSAIAAALGSLKGPKHGGANLKVMQMFKDLKEKVNDWKDEEAIEKYLSSLLNKEGFDKSGLIYGMGHAIYSISDPRAGIFKGFVEKLSKEKNLTDEYELYATVEKIASKLIMAQRKNIKGISANIDFYSGFVYTMLGLPIELYTPIFAIARISGWSAHRIEELTIANKIIRPAYMSIQNRREYICMKDRK